MTTETTEEEKTGWLRGLRSGLSRSAGALGGGIGAIFTDRELDDAALDEFEELLIGADLGVETAARMRADLATDRFGRNVTGDEVRAALAEKAAAILEPVAQELAFKAECKPQVVLVVGVNGTGKTTTIGKLAQAWTRAGKSVVLAAGDTFRAAAIEQIKIWGARACVPVVAGKPGGDAAGLAFEAIEQARSSNADIVLIDTAGRLQNKADLMAELEKIVRVVKKVDASAPHNVLLVLDATTGQNALSQVEVFQNVCDVTGLVMTKLDGTARGGVLVALAARFGLPVHAIGVGEKAEDLQPFSARDFARALVGLDE